MLVALVDVPLADRVRAWEVMCVWGGCRVWCCRGGGAVRECRGVWVRGGVVVVRGGGGWGGGGCKVLNSDRI